MQSNTGHACPLCGGGETRVFAGLHGRIYYQCRLCVLTFLAPVHHPSPEQELLRYASHRNDPADARYREYLSPLVDALASRLRAGAAGLDFGSGPGPALPSMLEGRGYRMALYDPFFAPDTAVLARQYDFIACSETAEHFAAPAREFDRFDQLLRPAGWLGLMTQVLHDDAGFPQWHYARDATHLCFYKPETFAWIAARYGWSLHRPHDRVALFQKS